MATSKTKDRIRQAAQAAYQTAREQAAKKTQSKPAQNTGTKNTKSTDTKANSSKPTQSKQKSGGNSGRASVKNTAKKGATQVLKTAAQTKKGQQAARVEKAMQAVLDRDRFSRDVLTRQQVRSDNLERQHPSVLPDAPFVRERFNPKALESDRDWKQLMDDYDINERLAGRRAERATHQDVIRTTTLDPLSALKADSRSHANFGRGAGMKPKELTPEERAQKEERDRAEQARKDRAAGQALSKYDQRLPDQIQEAIRLARADYDEAAERGDRKAMQEAHRRAETWRRIKGGYSGGRSGDEYIAPEISAEDRANLTEEGLRRLASAKIGWQNSWNDTDRARYAQMGEAIRRNPAYQRAEETTASYWEDAHGRRHHDITQEEREQEREQAAAIPKAIAAGIAGSFASIPTTTVRALQQLAYENQSGLQNLSDIRGGGELNISAPGEINPDSLGQRLLRKSNEYREKATEGQTGLERYLTEALITGGEMIPGLAATALSGGAAAPGLALMGAQAAGRKMGTLEAQGISPDEAFERGVLAGAIEAGTERIPLRNLAKIAKGGGSSFARNLATQALEEVGTEEISEVGNYLADKAFRDPNASLTAQDLKDTAVISLLTSLGMGAGAGMIGSARGGQAGRQAQRETAAMDTVTPGIDTLAAQEAELEAAEAQWKMAARRNLDRLAQSANDPTFHKHLLNELRQHEAQGEQLRQQRIGLEMQKAQRTQVEQQKAEQAAQQQQEANAQANALNAALDALRTDRRPLPSQQTERASMPPPLNVSNTPQEAAESPQTAAAPEQGQTIPEQREAPAQAQEMGAGVAREARADVSSQFNAPENHIDNRDSGRLGDRKIKAFQWDHPEVKPYFQDAARALLADAQYSDASRMTVRASKHDIWLGRKAGTIMQRNEPLNMLHDMGLSTPEIMKACEAIINDQGQENYAAAKRVELALDYMLSNGYSPVESGGDPSAIVRPSEAYLNLKAEINGGTSRGSWEEYRRAHEFILDLGDISEEDLRAEWEAQQNQQTQAEQEAEPTQRFETAAEEAAYLRGKLEALIARRSSAVTPEQQDQLDREKDEIDREIQDAYDRWHTDQAQEAEGQPDDAQDTRYSVGAAPGGFDPYSRMANEYGTIEPGENPARMVDVPRSTNGEDRVSKAARTFLEAQITSDPTQRRIERDIVNGLWSHSIKGLDETMDRAYSFLDSRGLEAGIQRWQDVVDGKVKASEDDMALGIALFANAERTGHSDYSAELAAQIAAEGTTAGRMANAIRLLKRTTPEGKVYYVKKMYDKIQNDLTEKYGKKAPKLETNEELLNRYRDAETEAEREKALDDIYLDIAKQMPRRLGDVINAWRYLAMLGNPRTHIRNVIGNVLFSGLEYASGKASAVVQRAVLPQEQRTRALRASRAAREFASQDYLAMKDVLAGDKYDGDLSAIQRKVQERALGPFSFLSQGNSRLLSWEDLQAKKFVYRRSLAEFITARGWDPNNLTTAQLEQARGHAIHDAQVATFQEENAAAKAVSRFEQTNKASKVLVGGVMPFKSVPFNIAKQGLAYSPIGAIKSGRDLARALSDMKNDVQTGRATAAEAIDGLTRGLTGSSILAVGALLAAKGLLTAGGSDDDDLENLDTAQGSQEYALKIGDRSYTLDWAAPTALPLFMGAEAYNIYHDMTTQAQGDEGEEGEELDTADKTVKLLNAVISSGTRFFEPMMNMTVLSGVSGAIKSAAYADDPLTGVWLNMIQNYAGQFVPTLLGQVNRTFFDDTRRTTFVDKNSPLDATWQRFLQRQENKIPGVSQKNMPYLDVWGRESRQENPLLRALENFVSPGYLKKVKDSQVGDELKRLNDAGFEDVLPKKPTAYSKINGEYMTQDQYMDRTKAQGKTALDLLMEAVKDKGYKDMSDQEKAEYVKSIFDYAKEKGKQAAGAEVTKKVAALDQAAKDYSIGVGALLRASMRVEATGDTDGNGSIKTEEAWNAIQGMDVSENEKRALFDLHNGTKQSYDEYVETAKKVQEKAKKEAEAAEKATALLGSSATVDVNTFQSEVDAIGGFNQMSYTNFFDTMDKLGIPEKERANYYEIVQSYKGHPWKKTYAEAKKYKGR